MLALQIGDDAAIGLIDAAEPRLVEPTDVIVRVTTTTICGGDVHLRHGVIPAEPNFVSGHEYVGVVEEIGEAVRTLVPGDRVVGAAIVSCGVCDRCRVGAPQGCRSGGILGAGPSWGGFGGSHAERLRVPFADRTAAKVPDSTGGRAGAPRRRRPRHRLPRRPLRRGRAGRRRRGPRRRPGRPLRRPLPRPLRRRPGRRDRAGGGAPRDGAEARRRRRARPRRRPRRPRSSPPPKAASPTS